MAKPSSCEPNPFGTTPFVLGWEHAFLGNCLSSLANLVVFSVRTNVPVIYPHIDVHREVFADPGNSRAVYDPDRLLDPEQGQMLMARVDPYFEGYYPGYESRISTIAFSDLPSFSASRGIMLFLQYHHLMHIRDWSEDGMESRAGRFCKQGNGLILPGAFWNQYTDMREATTYGPAVRAHIGALREDGCVARRDHMARHPGHLKIAIQIRQSDYKNWYGGDYYYAIDDYVAIMRHIDQTLASVPHVFYVFSEATWSADDFLGLPVFYEASHFLDDFVTMGRCDYVVGPPSTFATWSAFLGGAKRIIITKARISALSETPTLLDFAVDIPFPTGGYLPGDPQARPL